MRTEREMHDLVVAKVAAHRRRRTLVASSVSALLVVGLAAAAVGAMTDDRQPDQVHVGPGPTPNTEAPPPSTTEASPSTTEAPPPTTEAPPTTVEAGAGTVAHHGLLVADEDGVHVVTEGGTRLGTVIEEPVRAFFDDGAGGLVYQLAWPDDGQQPRSLDQARTWHLPAGATEAVPLVDTDDPELRWSEVRGVGTLAGRTVVAYASMRHRPGADPFDAIEGDLVLRDLESGEDRTVLEGAYGWEHGAADVSFAGDRLAFEAGYPGSAWQVRDADLGSVPTPCRNEDTVNPDCPVRPGVLLDGDTLVGLDEAAVGGEALVVARIADGTIRRIPLPSSDSGGLWTAVDALDGRVVVSTAPGWGAPFPTTLVLDVAAGTVTEVPATGTVRFLRAPIVRPDGEG